MARIAGLDYGRARIGVAISDETALLAQPVGCVSYSPKAFQEILQLLKPYTSLEAIVIGLPLEFSGKEGKMAQEVRAFAEKLQALTPIPIVFWDERLTTAQVERSLKEGEMSRKKRTKVIDALAATLILQSYLDSPLRKSN